MSLLALLSARASASQDGVGRFARNLLVGKNGRQGHAVFSSTLLHFAVCLFVIRVPVPFFYFAKPSNPPLREQPLIYYYVKPVDLARILPRIADQGQGGRPGRGIHFDHAPALGSDVFHPRFKIISNPTHPNNSRQTIIQPHSPPDLRIHEDLKLPNLIADNPVATLKPRIEFRPSAPIRASGNTSTDAAAPSLQRTAIASDTPFALAPATVAKPHFAVAPALTPVLRGRTAGGGLGGSDAAGDVAAPGLLVLTTDPSGALEALGLPAGNRYGAFSISPAGATPGSPNGVAEGDAQGGSGGIGKGGDGSSGVGPGGKGGGGSEPGRETAVSVSSTGNSSPGADGELLEPFSPEKLVFAVATLPRVPNPSFLITTGAAGGGGLRIYGVLRCGKIYSITIPMPRASWILEYCEQPAASGRAQRSSTTPVSTIQISPSLSPPDPEEKFDFYRLPVPKEKQNSSIVLRGVIRADGAVTDLRVHQGVLREMDEAAVAAFRRWKFKPVTKDGKPVAVQILVGIPPLKPGQRP